MSWRLQSLELPSGVLSAAESPPGDVATPVPAFLDLGPSAEVVRSLYLLSIDQYQCPQDRHWWLLDHLASSGLAAVAAALASLAPTSPGSEVAAPKE